MTAVERRFEPWLDVVGDLLARPLTDFPRHSVARQLSATFQTVVTWNWKDSSGMLGCEIDRQLPDWPTAEVLDVFVRDGASWHPLLRWFTLSRDTSPMSTGRIPGGVVAPESYGMLRDLMEPVALEQQLAIPYRLGESHYRAYVLARTREDFSDEDFCLAQRLQPLLTLLARQVDVLGRTSPCGEGRGLTGRELAILQLLTEGSTATAIGHRLGISPRTVQKHLEHLYRKLGVSDRLRAVVVARDERLLDGGRTDTAGDTGDLVSIYVGQLGAPVQD